VFEANQRCNQENLNAQLKGGVRALQAPLDDLESNWAYMVMVALGWNLKAWWALWPTETPGRYAERHRQDKERYCAWSSRRLSTRSCVCVPDRPHESAADLSLAKLESLERDVPARLGPAPLLTGAIEAGVWMLRSTAAS